MKIIFLSPRTYWVCAGGREGYKYMGVKVYGRRCDQCIYDDRLEGFCRCTSWGLTIYYYRGYVGVCAYDYVYMRECVEGLWGKNRSACVVVWGRGGGK